MSRPATTVCAPSRARRAEGGRPPAASASPRYVEVTAPLGLDGEYGAAQAHPDGTFTVMAGTSAHGQGHETAFAQLVAERPRRADGHQGRPVRHRAGARGAGTLGRARCRPAGARIHNASEQWCRGPEIAAHLLEAGVDDIELTDGGLGVKGVAGRESPGPGGDGGGGRVGHARTAPRPDAPGARLQAGPVQLPVRLAHRRRRRRPGHRRSPMPPRRRRRRGPILNPMLVAGSSTAASPRGSRRPSTSG